MNNGFRTYNAIPEGRATIKPGRSTEAGARSYNPKDTLVPGARRARKEAPQIDHVEITPYPELPRQTAEFQNELLPSDESQQDITESIYVLTDKRKNYASFKEALQNEIALNRKQSQWFVNALSTQERINALHPSDIQNYEARIRELQQQRIELPLIVRKIWAKKHPGQNLHEAASTHRDTYTMPAAVQQRIDAEYAQLPDEPKTTEEEAIAETNRVTEKNRSLAIALANKRTKLPALLAAGRIEAPTPSRRRGHQDIHSTEYEQVVNFAARLIQEKIDNHELTFEQAKELYDTDIVQAIRYFSDSPPAAKRFSNAPDTLPNLALPPILPRTTQNIAPELSMPGGASEVA
ncbi:MAG: hypothetical protein HOE53_00410 [Candidatus Magasanikbacteria bacterium]|nr:hypothetical protein [Candidatus Magasanikbacteria bacterium]